MARPKRWDVFCNVVDNYGDAGVAWRLARMLAAEHAVGVTLWIDALAPLARIAPGLDGRRTEQRAHGVTVRLLSQPLPEFAPADVVVEAFVAGLPDEYVQAMAAMRPPPCWFRLEYLALEPKLESHHALPSPHPSAPLARTFWIPGFSPGAGGLLRERGLLAARNAFAADASAQRALWDSLGVARPSPGELRVSMFCYPDAPLMPLLARWTRSSARVTCLVPEGVAARAIERYTRRAAPAPRGRAYLEGRLSLAAVPFVDQDAYDRMLWACDVNFVRGEDSFVRAQWAARPFVWQAYAQSGLAHAAKVESFLDRYAATLSDDAAQAVRSMFAAWNEVPGAPPIEDAWDEYVRALGPLRAHGAAWADSIAALPELASALVNAADNRL